MTEVSLPTTRITLLTRLRTDPSDPASWDEFVERYGRHIFRWCQQWKLQAADAEDLTQNILMKTLPDASGVRLRSFAQLSRLAQDGRLPCVVGPQEPPPEPDRRRGRSGSGNDSQPRGTRRPGPEAGAGLRSRAPGNGQGPGARTRRPAHLGGVPAAGAGANARRRSGQPRPHAGRPWSTWRRARCRRCCRKKSRSSKKAREGALRKTKK